MAKHRLPLMWPRCGWDSARFSEEGWAQEGQSGRNTWQGNYRRDGKNLIVHAASGVGDVVATVGATRVRAESKGGGLVKKKSNPEYPRLRELIGHLMTTKLLEQGDLMVAAVPDSDGFRRLATQWSEAPLMRFSGIVFALVGRTGEVRGLGI